LSEALPFGSEAPKRSSADLVLAADFNGLDMVFHMLRAPQAQRIGFPDYAMDGLK
jgi:hypothetical protein